MRLILSLVLSVILTLASQVEAVARSEMAGATDQVVCGANGVAQVTLDATGHPVHRHPCTHCLAAGLLAHLAAAAAQPAAPAPRGQRVLPDLSAQSVTARIPAPFARGPPLPLV